SLSHPKIVLRSVLLLAIALLVTAGTATAAKRVPASPTRATASGPTPRITAAAAAQINALTGIKTTRSAVQNKIGSRLYLGMLNLRGDARLAPLPDFRFMRNGADGRVAINVSATNAAGVKAVAKKIEALGGVVKSMSFGYRSVEARLRLEDLELLAAMSQVTKIRQSVPRFTQAINVSEGDATHGADESRGFFGVNGTGVKVCVLSDGVDSIAALEASGDVSTVDVLPGQAGSGDEGSAMLEIIHDLAPGATLGFATAFTDEASFAQNILDLATDGCNIIVDDVIYLDESAHQDGPVAQAVNTVTGAGVLYFSSAGNEGNLNDGTSGTWEGDFNANGTLPAAGPGTAHDFGDGGQSVLVTLGGAVTVLTWAEHFDGAAGTGIATYDFDIYDMDGGLTTVFDAGIDTQDGTGNDDLAFEIMDFSVSGERFVILEFAAGTTTSVPMMNFINFRGEIDPALATEGATRGHSAAAAAFSTAATPAADSFDGITPDGPYPGLFTAANESESFTSDGRRRIVLGPTGTELCPGNRTSSCAADIRQKPDITAADGVACAAPGFNPFYGTSAAAPHAAAIAALMKQSVPAATPAQIRTAIETSAIDIELPGDDRDTGAGIIMAHAAIAALGGVPQAFLDDGTPVPAQFAGDGDGAIEPNEIWDLTVPLSNIGGASATAISAVLSTSTPGVTVIQPNSAYPNLAPAASAPNLSLYRFSVGPAAVCGVVIDFTLTVSYTGGQSPQVFNFSLGTGSAGAPLTFSYTTPVVPIPDSPGPAAIATLPVAAVPGNILDLDLRIDGTVCTTTSGATTVGIDHTFVSDLTVTLRSPATTTVLAINRTDGSGHNFCQTLLDDESVGPSIQSVATGAAPFTGTFTPNLPLSGFDGESANGAWQLEVQDLAGLDIGNIRAWSLIVTPAVCNAPALAASVTATKTITGGDQNSPGTVTYTITITNTGSGPVLDNAGNEFTDTLPAGLTVLTPTASSGVVSGPGVNPVTWNGTIPPSGSVTITIPCNIAPGFAGTPIANQGTVSFDSNLDGTNDSTVLTDAPGGTVGDPTVFIAGQGGFDPDIPTLSEWALMLLGLLLAGAGFVALRQRS
ncbi:MAG TPA: IPTL-CTERM sorting domain-containing protein, partial [Thermoanaerobaculia bacterium]|nr:IPTL-CTERM sorting domain-containing protein [Thermoanaerobaculia bacterium]